MNYYDEEITIGSGSDSKNVKVERLRMNSRAQSGASSGGGGGGRNSASSSGIRTGMGAGGSGSRQPQIRQRTLVHGNSIDDDGLLRDIIDHDDDDDEDDDDDDDDSNMRPLADAPQTPPGDPTPAARHSDPRRPQTRPGSIRGAAKLPTARAVDNGDSDLSDSESEGGAVGGSKRGHAPATTAADMHLDFTPSKWENLNVHQEVKDLFPYILKYTPQYVETRYHLQPFIPEYVPAVGDVDAFLKVTTPPLLHSSRQQEINEHIRKLGLYFLDEPSGEQSDPSLLNMKMRSVLTGSGVNPRSASAALTPIAKSPKDIDKWISEVEQVHMSQSIYDVQPRREIETLLLDWPRSFADAGLTLQEVYQHCLQNDISLIDYVRLLCERFGIEGPSETQADYILNVHTLFALYLAANQAWE